MQADQRIGIDLPQRLLVREDPDGQVSIAYNDPFFIADRHAVTGEQERLGLMARVLDDLARAGSAAGLTGVAARSAVAVTTLGADSSAAGQVDLALP